jgi:hypothetical protein
MCTQTKPKMKPGAFGGSRFFWSKSMGLGAISTLRMQEM